MAKLHRPHIPDAVKIAVAWKQLNAPEPIAPWLTKEQRLRFSKYAIAERLGCNVSELRLDHDPPLALRKYDAAKKAYTPDANDPKFLFWMTELDHRTKTIIRGANGQHPDRVLIKKERRRTRLTKKRKMKFAWPKRKLQSRSTFQNGR